MAQAWRRRGAYWHGFYHIRPRICYNVRTSGGHCESGLRRRVEGIAIVAKVEYLTLAPASSAEWRAWLNEHHDRDPGVLVVLVKKRSGLTGLGYDEAVEEALCFGWIDSKTWSLDGQHLLQTFTPRKPGGTWARSNKERVARLIEQGRMTPAGMAKIEQAQADGSWNALDDIEELTVPDDLAAALAGDAGAARNFAAFSPSARRAYLWWIKTAKRPETPRSGWQIP